MNIYSYIQKYIHEKETFFKIDIFHFLFFLPSCHDQLYRFFICVLFYCFLFTISYICKYIYMYIYTHIHTYTHTYVYLYIYIYIYIYNIYLHLVNLQLTKIGLPSLLFSFALKLVLRELKKK